MARASSNLAAQYLRMSSDGQDLSIPVQQEAISAYASSHGLSVVVTYSDEGRSGLTLGGRPGMQQLLGDVSHRLATFSTILVYDVSRWGRFQDPDASAYYEYHCRLHGVTVVYVNEPFTLDRSPMAAMMKNMKRAMAAEYSRELAQKTTAGQTMVISRGFQMGTMPCLGFRRVAVSVDGSVRPLERGQLKGRLTDRIRWVPAPPEEVELVRRIFEAYAADNGTLRGLAERLESEGVRASNGTSFTAAKLAHLLNCEALVGNFVWGRSNQVASTEGILRPDDDPRVRRARGVIEPVVPVDLWERAQKKRRWFAFNVQTPAEMLEQLRSALTVNPALKSTELRRFGCPCFGTLQKTFGSYAEALRLAGRDVEVVAKAIQQQRREAVTVSHQICRDIRRLMSDGGVPCVKMGCANVLRLGDTVVRMKCISRRYRRSGAYWRVNRLSYEVEPWVLVARMENLHMARDFLLLTREAFLALPNSMSDEPPTTAERLCTARALRARLGSLALI